MGFPQAEEDAYLFDASFGDGLTAEIQVNPEFGSADAALVEAQKYGWVIGQLPTALRTDVRTVWIHKGVNPFGGGNNNLLIHTGQAGIYLADGILEETLIHEAAHTSLDADHASAAGWVAAQSADGDFISPTPAIFPVGRIWRRVSSSTWRCGFGQIESRRRWPIRYCRRSRTGSIIWISSHSTCTRSRRVRPVFRELFTADFPNGVALDRNHPNPFNAATVIDYRVTEPGQVVLKIANLLGQEITTLVAEEKAAGSYKVVWDGRDRLGRRMASGVYLYRIEAQGIALTSKMLLLQ